MDGYAIRAGDTLAASEDAPVQLEVVGDIAAGASPDVTVAPHSAVRIATGAKLPPGADAVVPVEATTPLQRLYRLHEAKSFFVTRAKSNLKAQRRYSHPVDRSTGLICDQTIVLTSFYSRQDFDTPLRRVRFKDPTTGKQLVFLTNNFTLPAFTITELYRCRWQVELFFKWIKQHLRIKVFFGTSENAVKTQIWIAVSVYVLVAIVKKRLNLSASLYEMLQILSLTMFERIPLDQLLNKIIADDIQAFSSNQLNLFN